MQQAGQFVGGGYRTSNPSPVTGASFVPDIAPSFTNPTAPPSTYDSVPPYAPAPSYYASPHPDSSFNSNAPAYVPQGPCVPSPPLPPDSHVSLNGAVNTTPTSYFPMPNSYSPSAFSHHGGIVPPPSMPYSSSSSQTTTFGAPVETYGYVGYQSDSLQGGYTPSQTGLYGATKQGTQTSDLNLGLSPNKVAVYDQGGGLYPQGRGYDAGGYGQQVSFEQPYYERPSGTEQVLDNGGYDFDDSALGEVYAYDGGSTEPYGARGTQGKSWAGFETFSQSTGSSNNNFNALGDVGGSKLTKAIPKADTQYGGNGVQKYRVKLLPDSSSMNGPMDVLCQIGLDGVRMVAPSTNKTVRIYPLETIKRWEVNEPSVFTFWAKSSVDVEPRKIRLQSSSYTTNAILDTLTAACVQFSEMVGKDGPADTSKDASKRPEQTVESKKPSFADWVSFRAKLPSQEERQHWVPDEAVTKCTACGNEFGAFIRRHHCRNCGDVFCDKCTHGRIALTADDDTQPVRVCDSCLAEVTQRLANVKETSGKPPAQRTHEDLAKRLQEEMDRNATRKPSARIKSGNSGQDRSAQTSVITCSSCGSISLVVGSNTRCPSCGADSSASKSFEQESGASNLRSYLPQGPPHLWSNQSNSEGSGKQMQEVACPTCTVHLQVQVPSFGTETVECGVCQHPFLVSAH
eukprot:c27126_g2_i1 orf=261-2309(-)